MRHAIVSEEFMSALIAVLQQRVRAPNQLLIELAFDLSDLADQECQRVRRETLRNLNYNRDQNN